VANAQSDERIYFTNLRILTVRKTTFWLSLVFISIVPWEDSVTIAAIGSLARLVGLVTAGFCLLTILKEGNFRKPNLFQGCVLLFFLWNVISYLWSSDPGRTFERINTYAQIFILIFILWELYQKPTDLIAGEQAYIFGGYVAITNTLINYLRGMSSVVYEVRYSVTGVNAVDLSLILLLGLPIAWHLFVLSIENKKNRILRLIYFCYIPLAIFSALLTGSRTALLAMVPALIYVLWPRIIRYGQSILILVLLVIALLILWSLIPQPVMDRLATIFPSIVARDLGGRGALWQKTIALFYKHPLLGSGSGTIYSTFGSDSHNTFLSVLAETGLIGLILFLTILLVVFVQAAKLQKGYSGAWIAVLLIWTIGASSLTWEFRKPTWLFLSFVILEGSSIYKQLHSPKVVTRFSGENIRQSCNDANDPQSLNQPNDII
jgi:O-antigen ligase